MFSISDIFCRNISSIKSGKTDICPMSLFTDLSQHGRSGNIVLHKAQLAFKPKDAFLPENIHNILPVSSQCILRLG